MKLKLYLQILFAAILAVLSTAGCDKDDKCLAPDPVTFQLQVTVNPGDASIAITPSDKTAMYFFGAMVKSEFDAFASENDFMAAESERLKTLAAGLGVSLQDYLEAYGKHGEALVTLKTTVPLTPYYAYAYTIDAAGKVTSAVFKTEFTSGEAPATAPKLELNLTPGDILGLDKDIKLTVSGKSTGVTSGRVLLVIKEELDKALAQGATLENIINEDKNSYPLEPEELEALNSEAGWKYSFSNLTPGTVYTTVVKVTNAIGSTIESISESTLADAGSKGPALDLSMTRGDREGNNKTTNMTVSIRTTEAMAGRYGLFAKTQVDAAIEQGYTLSYIIENNGASFTREQIDLTNSAEGFVIDVMDLEPNKSYTFIAKVASPGGTTIKTASATTTTGIGPAVTVTMVPGDKDGKNTDVTMLVGMKSFGVLAARQAIMPKDEFDEAVKTSTPAELLDTHGKAFTTEELAALNSETGLDQTFGSLTPNTAYMHILEAEDDNGISFEYTSALTTASSTVTSDMTFRFEVEDLAPTSAILSVIPSNNTETYYFDYLEAAEFDKLTDAQWIAKLIGDSGISSSQLSTGIAGYDASWFDMMALTAGTDYYIYAFGYDAEAKSATTALSKYKFTTPTGKETPTAAYQAWIGTWTVQSTSSEKDGTVVSFDITISQKVVNTTYTITGWGINSYRSRPVTAALKSDGGFRINNQQEIATLSSGTLTFTARYFKPSTMKYALVSVRTDGLTGTLNADNQTAIVNGGTFTVDGDPTEHTITSMDYFNHKFTDSWTSFTALAAYKDSGYPTGPYTLTKTSSSAVTASVPVIKAPATNAYKSAMMKHALTKQIIASMSLHPNRDKKDAGTPAKVHTAYASCLKLADGSNPTFRTAAKQLVIVR